MATTSSTLIFIGNFADIDTDETNNTIEDPSGIYQTYTQADMTAVQVDQNDVNDDGQVQTDNNGQTPDTFSYDVGGGPVTNGLDSAGRFFVDYVDQNGDPQSTVASVYQTDNGDVFLKFPDGLQIRNATITGKQSDGFSSITHGTSSSAQVVCFASGTCIETPGGQRRVEDLAIGDHVVTVDHWRATRAVDPQKHACAFGRAAGADACPDSRRRVGSGPSGAGSDRVCAAPHPCRRGRAA